MKLLLDTHAFIWLDDDASGRLSEKAVEALADLRTPVYLSVATVWEVQIKVALGQLTLRRPLKEALIGQRESNGLRLLPIRSRHIFALDWLPDHHRDPFNRILVAQAVRDDLTLVTCDPQIAKYPVPTLW